MYTLTGVAALFLLCTPYIAAQDSEVQPDIPGLYGIRKCTTAEFPVELPSLESVLDTSQLTLALREASVDQPVVFALRLGALQTAPRVRVVEKKVSDAAAELVAQKVEAALVEVTSSLPWAFRLSVDARQGQAFSLNRSEVCGASPTPGSRPPGGGQLRSAPVTELRAMEREAQDNLRRRRAMRHRVLVDARGRVLKVELLATSGDGQMDAFEANALRNATFVPTKLDGVAVGAWVEVRGDSWSTRP